MISFAERFPLSTKLGLTHIKKLIGRHYTDGVFYDQFEEHDGFDELDVRKKLGQRLFEKLSASVKEVFVCAHALYPDDHDEAHKRGTEVHCFHARDVEALLQKERG